MTLDKYEKTLDIWANEERAKAAEAERFKLQEDYDAAEKSEIKAATIRRALELIENGDE